MSAPTRFSLAVFALLMVCLSACGNRTDLAPLDSLWKSATDTSLSWENRRQFYEEWNSVARTYGLRSASAYNNLAYGDWKANNTPGALVHLIHAAGASDSVLQAWRYLGDARLLEQRLGNKDQLSRHWNFRLFFLAGENFRLVLLVVLGWGTLIGALLLLFRGRFAFPPQALTTYWSIFFLVTVFAAYVEFNHRTYPGVGVLNGDDGGVQTFLNRDPEQLLVKLPSGTLVRLIQSGPELSEIDFPVAAWVSTKSLDVLVPLRNGS